MAKLIKKNTSLDNSKYPLFGDNLIKEYQKTLPNQPGVYRMLDKNGTPLYVGKAKNLKKRVATYTKKNGLNLRIRNMVAATASMEFVTTHTEVEALLLESNLIKKLKPRFNILLRDDKSFPYILITKDHPWPQITKHRGAKTRKGKYFGPFASVTAVNETIKILQKAFPLRNCTDNIFSGRSRPCLQYQIKRCSAPCVGYIDSEAYQVIVDQTKKFLAGKSSNIQKDLSDKMEKFSKIQDYENAAIYRDRINALTQIQAQQGINTDVLNNADVIAISQQADQSCVQVFFFRSGQHYGNRAYFPSHTKGLPPDIILEAFIGQFYESHSPPPVILLSKNINNIQLIESALSIQTKYKVSLNIPIKGKKKELILHAEVNALEALNRRMAESASQRKLLDELAIKLQLESPPERIEVYDNSHISGSSPVGGMIVVGSSGFLRNQYRKFNIKNNEITPGDDYGMMREVLFRRFSRLIKESELKQLGTWPDLVIIDGGAGHLSEAELIFEELGITGIPLVSIAKGKQRNLGREKLYLSAKKYLQLDKDDPLLFFLQRIRDESHRFAIESHRNQRSKKLRKSVLDEISGVGTTRKRALLNHFGSAQAVSNAGLKDLTQVKGISGHLANLIYIHFHSKG